MSLDPIAYARANPITATAIVAVVVIGGILILMPGGGSTSQVSANPAQDPQFLAAQMQVGLQQYSIEAQARQQNNALLAQVRMAEITGANQLAVERLRYDTQGDITDAEIAGALATAGIQASLRRDEITALGNLEAAKIAGDFATTRLLSEAEVTTELAGIAASRDANMLSAQTQQLVVQSQAATTRTIAELQSTTTQNLATLQAQTQQFIAGTNAQTQQYVAGVTATSQQVMAQTLADTQKSISRDQAQVSITQSNNSVKSATQGGWMQIAGAVIGAIL